MLTADQLREALDYNPETGEFSRRHGQACNNGTNSIGYVQIMVNGKMYAGHRLAWLHTHGTWPANEIDHLNLIRSDNRLINLRECTRSENCRNVPRHSDNKSGYKGVFKFRNKWSAQICRDGKKKHLGVFDTPELAYSAYCAAAQYHFGEFARVA